MDDTFWLESVFREMQLDAVRAHLHHCEKSWDMKERILGDDMFFYIVKGRGVMRVEDREYPLYPGVCGNFRRKIRQSASHDPQHPIDVIVVHYTATMMQSLTLPEMLGFPDFFAMEGDAVAKKYFLEAAKETTDENLGYGRAVEALVTRILLHLVRAPEYRKTMKLDYHEARHADLLRLHPALSRMSANLIEPESIEELARMTGFSVAQFRRVFSRSLHMSPVEYMRRLRMTHACRLLRTTTQTIEEISANVGYQEVSFFARTFKEFMGVSPGRYRHQAEI
ncbi:MAG: AraC family transcriptional regulator [Chthoniobacterales bacterium]